MQYMYCSFNSSNVVCAIVGCRQGIVGLMEQMTTGKASSLIVVSVAVSLRATISQAYREGELSRMCQLLMQGRDKSRQTIRSYWRVLQAYILCSRIKRGVTVRNKSRAQEDKLDCYCVNCGAYILAARLLTKLFYGACKSKQYYYALTQPVLIIVHLLC